MSPGPSLLPWCQEQSHTLPGAPGSSLSKGWGQVSEVRSPQLNKANVAQLPRISAKILGSSARMAHRHQLHSRLAAPVTPSTDPHQPSS